MPRWLNWLFLPHRHMAEMWDGFFEFCRCGRCAGDLRDADGMRHISFDTWPEEARMTP